MGNPFTARTDNQIWSYTYFPIIKWRCVQELQRDVLATLYADISLSLRCLATLPTFTIGPRPLCKENFTQHKASINNSFRMQSISLFHSPVILFNLWQIGFDSVSAVGGVISLMHVLYQTEGNMSVPCDSYSVPCTYCCQCLIAFRLYYLIKHSSRSVWYSRDNVS